MLRAVQARAATVILNGGEAGEKDPTFAEITAAMDGTSNSACSAEKVAIAPAATKMSKRPSRGLGAS